MKQQDLRDKLPSPFTLLDLMNVTDKDAEGVLLTPEQMKELYSLLVAENARRLESGSEVRIAGGYRGLHISSEEKCLTPDGHRTLCDPLKTHFAYPSQKASENTGFCPS